MLNVLLIEKLSIIIFNIFQVLFKVAKKEADIWKRQSKQLFSQAALACRVIWRLSEDSLWESSSSSVAGVAEPVVHMDLDTPRLHFEFCLNTFKQHN